MGLLDQVAIFAGVQLRSVVRSLLTYLALNTYPELVYGIISFELPAGWFWELLTSLIPYQTLDVLCWGASCRIYNWNGTFLPRLLLSGNLENWRAFWDTAWLSDDLIRRTAILALIIILTVWFAVCLITWCFSLSMALVRLWFRCCLVVAHELKLTFQLCLWIYLRTFQLFLGTCIGTYELIAAMIALQQDEEPRLQREHESQHDNESYMTDNVQEIGQDREEVSEDTPTKPVGFPLQAETELTPDSRANSQTESSSESRSSTEAKAASGLDTKNPPKREHSAQEQPSSKPKSPSTNTKPKSPLTSISQTPDASNFATFNMGSSNNATSGPKSHSSPPKQGPQQRWQEKQGPMAEKKVSSPPLQHTHQQDHRQSQQQQPSSGTPMPHAQASSERASPLQSNQGQQPQPRKQQEPPVMNDSRPREGPKHQSETSLPPRKQSQQPDNQGSEERNPKSKPPKPQAQAAGQKAPASQPKQGQQPEARHPQQHQSGKPTSSSQAGAENGKKTPPSQPKSSPQAGPHDRETPRSSTPPKQQYKAYRPVNTPPTYKAYRPETPPPEQPPSPPGRTYYQQESSYHSKGRPHGNNSWSGNNSSHSNPNSHSYQNTGSSDNNNSNYNHSSHTRQDQYQQYQHYQQSQPTNPPPAPPPIAPNASFDPYLTLSIPRNATAREIKVGFYKACRLHHPDKADKDPASQARADAATKDINRANDLLNHKLLRQIYDLRGIGAVEDKKTVEKYRKLMEQYGTGNLGEAFEKERQEVERIAWERYQAQRHQEQRYADASGADGCGSYGTSAAGGSGRGGNDGGFHRFWKDESRTTRRVNKERKQQEQQQQQQQQRRY